MLTGRTIARLAQPFEGGGGPSHGTIDRIWAAEDAIEYLGEGNKMERVLTGLRSLRDGRRASHGQPALPPDNAKLKGVASELAELLLATGQVNEDDVAEALSGGAPATERTRSASSSERSASSEPLSRDVSEETVEPAPRPQRAADPARVMVVYGQDEAAKRAMFDWLRSVGLRPSEWNQLVSASGVASPFIGDVLDGAFAQVQAVVVLFTPDEHVKLRKDLAGGASWRLQSRPNVLLEAGMALATHPERTVLVVLGDQSLPSDLAGRHYVRLGTPQSLRDLGQRLEAAGCPVDLSGGDWLETTRFPSRDSLPRDL